MNSFFSISLSITKDGIEALYNLCEGDMRKIVNMLQSIDISLKGKIHEILEIDAGYVYKLTGNATPEDIKEICKVMMNEDLTIAYESLHTK